MNTQALDLSDLLNVPEFEKIQDQIAKLTGTAIITIDFKGTPITKHSERTDFCTIIRENQISCKRCQRCDALAGLEAVRRNRPFIYLCHCGIVDVAVPVSVGNVYLGAVMFGQVRIPRDDTDARVERLVNEISSFNEENENESSELLEMYNRLPEMEYEQIEQVADILATKMYAQNDSFSLMAIPFFMLAGQVMETTGITEKIISFAHSLVGHIRGGLAHTATLTGMIMAGVSGSANADGAAIGSVMLPALKKDGYDEGQAVSIIAAAGSLGPIIPPSIFMIILCNATGSNIGKLFLAGVIPGLLMGVGFMVVNYVYAKRHNIPVTKFEGFKHIWDTFKVAIWALLMPIIIIGGILGGVFTATEAGVVASAYGIIYGFLNKSLTLPKLRKCLTEGVVSSIGPMLLIACSGVFAYMLTSLGTDKIVANFVLTYIPNQHLFLLFMLLLGLLLGCFIDSIASCLMLMPILTPIVATLGIDFLHFSIVFTMAFLTCTITPPVGTLLYVICGIDGTPVMSTVKPILPYVGIMALVVILTIFIPQLGIWLPSFL